MRARRSIAGAPAASGEVGQARPVEEHGRLCLSEDAFGHAAEDDPSETAPAGSGHRDQVGVESVRLLEDLVERVAEAAGGRSRRWHGSCAGSDADTGAEHERTRGERGLSVPSLSASRANFESKR